MSDEILNLLSSKDWPAAVPQSMLVDETNEDHLKERAEYILKDVLKTNLVGKKFLDYGCGTGHVASLALKDTPDAFGYDIVKADNKVWKDNEYSLTSRLPVVVSNGPYDVILVHDTIDHSMNPVYDFSMLFKLIKRDGIVFIRFHPICGRHGGHLYRTFNKAFAHMVLSEGELKELGLTLPYQKVLYPIKTYEEYLKKTGFKILGHKTVSQFVEPFFERNKLVADRIAAFYGDSSGRDILPSFQMSQNYVDFLVTK